MPLGLRTVFQYDGPGNRVKRTDANGAVTTYAYDTVNRPVTMTYPQGSSPTPTTAPTCAGSAEGMS